MGRSSVKFLLVVYMHLALFSVAYGSNIELTENSTQSNNTSLKILPYNLNRDIAFISVGGSKPDTKLLQGYHKAIFFNIRGEVLQKVDIKNDSIYSLDKMIQENRSRGPLIIKMYR